MTDVIPGFELGVLVVALVAGATASVVGFGIGSLLTPLIAVRHGAAVAIAAVTIPHLVATAIRCWRLRASVDRTVLSRFGVLSAIGGLIGALAYARAGSGTLGLVLGVLLILTAIAQISGLAENWRPRGVVVGVLGFASGAFGGVAGNQGGLRSAALSSFRLTPAAFVATSAATGLIVDAVRTPVYLVAAGGGIASIWKPILIATIGVTLGTFAGERILLGMARDRFVRVVAVGIGLLGGWLVVTSLAKA